LRVTGWMRLEIKSSGGDVFGMNLCLSMILQVKDYNLNARHL
jgi:hypothetical protein